MEAVGAEVGSEPESETFEYITAHVTVQSDYRISGIHAQQTPIGPLGFCVLERTKASPAHYHSTST